MANRRSLALLGASFAPLYLVSAYHYSLYILPYDNTRRWPSSITSTSDNLLNNGLSFLGEWEKGSAPDKVCQRLPSNWYRENTRILPYRTFSIRADGTQPIPAAIGFYILPPHAEMYRLMCDESENIALIRPFPVGEEQTFVVPAEGATHYRAIPDKEAKRLFAKYQVTRPGEIAIATGLVDLQLGDIRGVLGGPLEATKMMWESGRDFGDKLPPPERMPVENTKHIAKQTTSRSISTVIKGAMKYGSKTKAQGETAANDFRLSDPPKTPQSSNSKTKMGPRPAGSSHKLGSVVEASKHTISQKESQPQQILPQRDPRQLDIFRVADLDSVSIPTSRHSLQPNSPLTFARKPNPRLTSAEAIKESRTSLGPSYGIMPNNRLQSSWSSRPDVRWRPTLISAANEVTEDMVESVAEEEDDISEDIANPTEIRYQQEIPEVRNQRPYMYEVGRPNLPSPSENRANIINIGLSSSAGKYLENEVSGKDAKRKSSKANCRGSGCSIF